MMGLSSLLVIVWILMLGHGSVSFASGFLIVITLTLPLTSVHELWARKARGRQPQQPNELPPSFSTKELPGSQEAPAASVTESTTRKLKAETRRGTREDDLD